jgi:hypothetical protein
MTLKQALWEIVRDDNIIITNQNIDWLLDRALKKATGDAQTLKESILERKEILDEKFPTNENKCIYAYDGEVEEYCVQSPCPNYKTIEQAKQEVAREIFEEIEEMCVDGLGNFHPVVFAELKKKYTESEDK